MKTKSFYNKTTRVVCFMVLLTAIYSCKNSNEINPAKVENTFQGKEKIKEQGKVGVNERNSKPEEVTVQLDSYWELLIPKIDLINSMTDLTKEELKRLEGSLPDEISYIISIKDGNFEEFIQTSRSINQYERMVKYPVDMISNSNSLIIHEFKNANPTPENAEAGIKIIEDLQRERISIGDKIIAGMSHSIRHRKFIIIENSGSGELTTCCAWCWRVHNFLSIHDLDCICCLANCKFSCGGIFSFLNEWLK